MNSGQISIFPLKYYFTTQAEAKAEEDERKIVQLNATINTLESK